MADRSPPRPDCLRPALVQRAVRGSGQRCVSKNSSWAGNRTIVIGTSRLGADVAGRKTAVGSVDGPVIAAARGCCQPGNLAAAAAGSPRFFCRGSYRRRKRNAVCARCSRSKGSSAEIASRGLRPRNQRSARSRPCSARDVRDGAEDHARVDAPEAAAVIEGRAVERVRSEVCAGRRRLRAAHARR